VPIVHPCAADGCTTLTMGDLCLEHEAAAEPEAEPRRPRGVAVAALVGAVAGVLAAVAARTFTT
jgi:hypothetical protein